MTVDWSRAPEFGTLCDLVASDHLVCMTGAGISREMRRKHRKPGGDPLLPSWLQLLRELLAQFAPRMSAENVRSAERLLDPEDERPPAREFYDIVQKSLSGAQRSEALQSLERLGPAIGSSELILAATLIRRADRKAFDQLFREAVTEEPGQCTVTHEALLDLVPRGILTFNYDGGHDEACRRAGCAYEVINPTDPDSESLFRSHLESRLEKLFLLKAHGSTDSDAPLVLTVEEYRNLLAKNPSYRAFVQNLFTNFNFLVVGYGLDDPDFDLFLRTMAEQFAGPLQKHVVVRLNSQRHRYEEVERELYGIHTLHLNHFSEIPEVLHRAATTAGPSLQRSLSNCFSSAHRMREQGHRELTELGPAGRAIAGRTLLARLDSPSSFIVSEAAYSLGRFDPKLYKERLCELIDTRSESDIVGRTLTMLRSTFELTDLPRLGHWLDRFTAVPAVGPRSERIIAYLEYLLIYVEHKYQSDPL